VHEIAGAAGGFTGCAAGTLSKPGEGDGEGLGWALAHTARPSQATAADASD